MSPKKKKSKPKSPPAGTKKSKNARTKKGTDAIRAAWEVRYFDKLTKGAGKKKPSKSPAKRKAK